MSKHTPGEWAIYDNSPSFDGKELRIKTIGGANHIATLCCINAEANAYLIAAAPEMLETLKILQQIIHEQHCGSFAPRGTELTTVGGYLDARGADTKTAFPNPCCIYCRGAKEVIAKAEGRE